ncbi:DNA/RNA-binding protein KIN17-like [Sycon ciliatum]|uniref:DNA/RNA-binding protein KIN17-like n=1 Tax=Sycon ciliatum TaxID=27933 RepID=UPI0031F6D860
MGKEKAGFMTPKAIGNRIKAKGLQKLRWYCQMCQKQCRDENGFKCHCMSESHQRQLLLFADNVDEYLDGFSKEFMETFMEMLKRSYGTRRVHCNIVYNEFIADREHLHMNATRWQTLTEFIMYLGKEGSVVVDPTEKGIFITYIDRDPETLRRQEILLKREKFEALEAEKAERALEEQVARGNMLAKPTTEAVYTELKRDEESDKKIAFSLFGRATSGASSAAAATSTVDMTSERGEDASASAPADADEASSSAAAAPVTASPTCAAEPSSSSSSSLATAASKLQPLARNNALQEAAKKATLAKQTSSSASRKRKSALEEIMEEEERKKRLKKPSGGGGSGGRSSAASSMAAANKDSASAWLHRGIVVKVMNKHSNLYKQKCTVESVTNRGCTAQLRDPDTGELVPVPDSDLETVIPAIGRSVIVLSGEHRGLEAVLEKINVENFCVNVTVVRNLKQLKRLPYEHVSKMASKK